MQRKIIYIFGNDKEFTEEITEALNINGFNSESFISKDINNKNMHFLKPDLIIIDLNITNYEEFEKINEIKKIKNFLKVPIIAITGYLNGVEEKNNIKNKFGFTECLIKPVNPVFVINEINKIFK